MVTDEMVERAVEEIRKAKHTCFDRWTDQDAMRAVLSAVMTDQVNVRLLEWEAIWQGRWRAKAPIGSYDIWHQWASDGKFHVSVHTSPHTDELIGGFDTLEAAKAAAQADYSAHIISALSISPAPVDGGEPTLQNPAPQAHLSADDHALAARYHRLHSVCARILWTDLGVPAMDNGQTKAAMTELSEIILMDALISASALATEGNDNG